MTARGWRRLDLAMPWLVETVFGQEYAGAVDAARIVRYP